MELEIIRTENHPHLGHVIITKNTEKAKEYLFEKKLSFCLFGEPYGTPLEREDQFDDMTFVKFLATDRFSFVAISLPAKDILRDILNEL